MKTVEQAREELGVVDEVTREMQFRPQQWAVILLSLTYGVAVALTSFENYLVRYSGVLIFIAAMMVLRSYVSDTRLQRTGSEGSWSPLLLGAWAWIGIFFFADLPTWVAVVAGIGATIHAYLVFRDGKAQL
ncbi:hypothetical protein [Corynebacterium doosanense]|uniref:Uncharacterized protein n=1 Tax=Corynebacterium doosanense CAU 212 = DSM 45436 TaxID=558173 RepID=A0A097IJH0_9CORY|nr:hypothetical protein [Corynebacterium doosanense]AIT62302.1 hypothetical protein CDOO_09365 [Corynebacterium doosanense CAU 212 = DSM 45436]